MKLSKKKTVKKQSNAWKNETGAGGSNEKIKGAGAKDERGKERRRETETQRGGTGRDDN